MWIQCSPDHFEIISHVCPVVNLASGMQHAGQQITELLVEQTTLMVTRLPPWIGEVDMDSGNTARWYQIGKQNACVTADDAGVMKLSLLQSFCGTASFAIIDLNAKNVAVRVSYCGIEKEQTATGSYIQLNRGIC